MPGVDDVRSTLVFEGRFKRGMFWYVKIFNEVRSKFKVANATRDSLTKTEIAETQNRARGLHIIEASRENVRILECTANSPFR